MKTRLRAIARTGTFGSKENEQTVTEKDLEELCDSFKGMNSSPITIGHDFKAQDPRLGNVVALELKDGILYAKTQEHDALFGAVEDGFFPDVSIGAKRSAETGKLYLHHLAYLGEEPPAIKDLRKSVRDSLAIAAGDEKDVIRFPPCICMSDTSHEGGSAMDEIAELKKKIEELEKENAVLKENGASSKATESNEGDDTLRKENEELKKKLKDLAEQHPELELSDRDPHTTLLMNELKKSKTQSLVSSAKGKLTPYALERLTALSDSLAPAGEIALSDGKKATQHELLQSILETLPEQMWSSDVIGLSDGAEKPETSASSAARLMKAM